jgi:hypothetical protein
VNGRSKSRADHLKRITLLAQAKKKDASRFEDPEYLARLKPPPLRSEDGQSERGFDLPGV